MVYRKATRAEITAAYANLTGNATEINRSKELSKLLPEYFDNPDRIASASVSLNTDHDNGDEYEVVGGFVVLIDKQGVEVYPKNGMQKKWFTAMNKFVSNNFPSTVHGDKECSREWLVPITPRMPVELYVKE